MELRNIMVGGTQVTPSDVAPQVALAPIAGAAALPSLTIGGAGTAGPLQDVRLQARTGVVWSIMAAAAVTPLV